MWTGVYWAKTYWPGVYWPPAGGVTPPVVVPFSDGDGFTRREIERAKQRAERERKALEARKRRAETQYATLLKDLRREFARAAGRPFLEDEVESVEIAAAPIAALPAIPEIPDDLRTVEAVKLLARLDLLAARVAEINALLAGAAMRAEEDEALAVILLTT